MSEEPALNPLPSGWSTAILGDHVQTAQYGLSLRGGQDGAYPILRMNNLQDGRLTTANLQYVDLGENELSKFRLRRNDLLFNRTNSIDLVGKTAVFDVPGTFVFASYLIRLTTDPETLDPSFAYYYLNYPATQVRLKQLASRGVSQSNINATKLKSLAIVLPPLSEQRAIAHVLRMVQLAKESTEKVIPAVKQLKKSLMAHLFRFGPVVLRDACQIPEAETGAGTTPAHWKVAELSSLLREPLRNGHSAQPSSSPDGIRTLTLTAVTQKDFSIRNTKVTVADPERVRDMWLKDQDVFIERANTRDYVGLAALYEGPDGFAIFPDLLVRVRVDYDRALPKFIAEFLDTAPCRNYFRTNAKATAGNFPKIDQPIIEKTSVPLPALETQHTIATMARRVDDKLRTEKNGQKILQDLFESLLHHLMTGKLRVHGLPLLESAGSH